MASEEKYLWVFTYRFHEENRIWWAYFRDKQEAEACIERLMGLFPCAKMLSLGEQVQGLRLEPYYYHYHYSNQQYADALDKKVARERDKRTFPLAPLASDYLSSFVVDVNNIKPCSKCEWPSLELVQPLPVLSRRGWDGRRGSRSDR